MITIEHLVVFIIAGKPEVARVPVKTLAHRSVILELEL